MAKKILSVKVECIAVNKRKNNGNVLFAVDVQPAGEDKQTAKTVLNYQTQNVAELKGFDTGETYTITFEQ